MKHNFKLPCMILATALAATLRAAVPLAWEARPNAPAPASFDRHHGETIDFRCTLTGFDAAFAPAADVRLWYQTNGMGQAWWSAPATVQSNVITATWSPALDPGADRVSLFFGAPSNVYASAVLRLRHSPGFTPSVLTLPVPTLDFSAVELRNLHALTNGWHFGGGEPGDYATVRDRVMRAVVTNRYGNATVGIWDFPGGLAVGKANDGFRSFFYPVSSGLDVNARDQAETIYHFGFDGVQTDDDVLRRRDLPAPPDLSGYATQAELQSVSDSVEDVRAESALVYRLYQGSNVVAEVTNFNSAAHAPELRIMQLNESNEYVTVWAETNGLARTLKAANDHADAATNAVRAQCEAAYAPRAWGRTTSGLGSDAPSNTTWISTGKLVIASGQEFVNVESSGLWVLCANGQFDLSSGTDAFFSISDQSGNKVFSVERTGDAPLPVYCSDITVRNEGGSKVITVPVPVVDATEKRNEPPYLNIATNLDGTWYSETNGIPSSIASSCEWTGQNGAWTNTVVVPASYGRMFLTYHKWQPGGTVIRNNAATDVSAGIWVNGTKFVPTVSGNNLIWTKQ